MTTAGVPAGLREALPRALAALRRSAAEDGAGPVALHVCCLLGALGGRVNAVQHALAPRSLADLFVLAASRAVSDVTLTSARNVREEVASLRAEILAPGAPRGFEDRDIQALQALEALRASCGGATPHRVWAVLTASGALPWDASLLFRDITAQGRPCLVAAPGPQTARIQRDLDLVWASSPLARECFEVLAIDAGVGVEPALRTIFRTRPASIVGIEAGPSTAQHLWSPSSPNASEGFRRALLVTTFDGKVHESLPRIDPAIDVAKVTEDWCLDERFAETWNTADGQWSATLRVQSTPHHHRS